MIYDYRDQVKAILQTVDGDNQASLLTGAVAIKSICETALATMQAAPIGELASEPKEESDSEQIDNKTEDLKGKLRQVSLKSHYRSALEFFDDIYQQTNCPKRSELSLALGIGRTSLYDFKNRARYRLGIRSIRNIADSLGVSADDLSSRFDDDSLGFLSRNSPKQNVTKGITKQNVSLEKSYASYGELLEDLQKKLFASQAELAAQLGVVQSTISYIVRGKNRPSDKLKSRLANMLNVTLDELESLVGEKPKAKFTLTSHTSNYELIDHYLTEPLGNDEYMVRRRNQLAWLLDQSGRELLALSWGMVRKYHLETGDIVTAKLTELKPKVLRVIHRHLGLDNFKLLRNCTVEKGFSQNEWSIVNGTHDNVYTSLNKVNPAVSKYTVPRNLITKLGISSQSKVDLIWSAQEPSNISIAAVHE